MEIINAWIAGKTIEVRCFTENVWRVYTCKTRNPPVNETLNSCEWRIAVAKVINQSKKTHPLNADLIKLWADGATIQQRGKDTEESWYSIEYPDWKLTWMEFRVKPEKKSDGQLMFECFSNQCEWENLNSKLFWKHAAIKFLASKAKQT